jgi:hypothetical protein
MYSVSGKHNKCTMICTTDVRTTICRGAQSRKLDYELWASEQRNMLDLQEDKMIIQKCEPPFLKTMPNLSQESHDVSLSLMLIPFPCDEPKFYDMKHQAAQYERDWYAYLGKSHYMHNR